MSVRGGTPKYGWCAGAHRPRKPAQSGYVDAGGLRYCKTCFRDLHPRLYAQKRKQRKGECSVCSEVRELVNSVCRPCTRRRTCASCQAVSENADLPLCRRGGCGNIAQWCTTCNDDNVLQRGLCKECWLRTCQLCLEVRPLVEGVCRPCTRRRTCASCKTVSKDADLPLCRRDGCGNIAQWCTACNDEDVLQRGLCKECSVLTCGFCGSGATIQKLSCMEEGCGGSWSLCRKCAPAAVTGPVLCRSCWRRKGRMCKECGATSARNAITFHRCCKECHRRWFCGTCSEMASPSEALDCRACCRAFAAWCSTCSTGPALQSGLCPECFSGSGTCQWCARRSPDVEVAQRPCSTNGCRRVALSCDSCLRRWKGGRPLCEPCWSSGGRMCISCSLLPAQTGLAYRRCCKSCCANADVAHQLELVAEESSAYLAAREARQTWDGSEPGLQVLILPEGGCARSARF